MKKSLVSALTTAMVIGAASTTFAAANPFADVPAEHWAYDAVSQLAADGVIEGYGDNNFKGDKNITRYEMAQMVAKAMAKTNVSGADKAIVDKLAAEFADELNNLGVRVTNLEKNADKVKWNGEARYTYKSNHLHYAFDDNEKVNSEKLLLRLEPTAEVNAHWSVKARLDTKTDLKDDAGDDGNVKLKRIWAQGNYGDWTIKAGKIPTTVDSDLILDGEFSGAQVDYGTGIKVSVGAGRYNLNNADNELMRLGLELTSDNGLDANTADYQFAGVQYNKLPKWDLGAAYHHFNSEVFAVTDFKEVYNYIAGNETKVKKNAEIVSVNAGYNFDNNWNLNGKYAVNTKAKDVKISDATTGQELVNSGDQRYAYRAELDYKGAQKANKGTWGAWLAYAHLGASAAINPTYDAMYAGEKGWEIGANYAPLANVVATVRYADTKDIASAWGKNNKTKHIFGRVEFFF